MHVQLHIQNTKACRKKWDDKVLKRPSSTRSDQPGAEDVTISIDNSLEIGGEQPDRRTHSGGGLDDPLFESAFDEQLPRQPYSDFPEPPASKCARVEEVEDEEAPTRFHRSYLGRAADVVGFGATEFEEIQAGQASAGGGGENPFIPFEDQEEWELAEWLMTETTQQARDKFLKLPIVSLC